MKTLVNKRNPAIKIIADTLLSDSFNYITSFCSVPKSEWTLVEEKSKHTEVWVEGRTIFEQEGEPEDWEKMVEFNCIGKKVKMTIHELINYYIDSECADVADECGF